MPLQVVNSVSAFAVKGNRTFQESFSPSGMLILDWMRGPPAPIAVLALMACKCVRTCKLPDCSCLDNKLKCTQMCKLQTCSNQKEEEDEVQLIDYDDTDDEY